MVTGAAGAGGLAGGLAGIELLGWPLEEGGGPGTLGGAVALVIGAGEAGGEVARGGGHGGSRELADNSRNCASAASTFSAD